MISKLAHRIARFLLPKSVRNAWGRAYWRLHKWWFWEFPVNPNFHLFVFAYFYQVFILRKPVVAVYQPGRVGSTSVTKAIRSMDLGLVFNVHTLSRDFQQHLPTSESKITPDLRIYIKSEKRIGPCLRWIIRWHLPLKIIVLLRDPIAQSLSHFFLNFKIFTGYSLEERDWTPGELLRLNWVKNILTGFNMFEWWFYHDLRNFTGLDILSQPFDRAHGWQKYRIKNLEIMVLKIELDNHIKDSVISNFLGLKDLQIKIANSATEKQYASLYRTFQSFFSLKQEELDKIYGSRFPQHFYTPEEITKFKQRWMKRD
jgi:hypothetical protein